MLGLTFPNRLGLAAGFDKNADHIDEFAAMGFGFIEVGTVTPRPQAETISRDCFAYRKPAQL